MADLFCPECGTVFEGTGGGICPNCAAKVGDVQARQVGKSGISVVPLAKDAGGKRGFMDMDGADLQLRDRDYVQQTQAAQGPDPAAVSSGLSVDGAEERLPANTPQMHVPELVKKAQAEKEAAAAAAAAEQQDMGKWARVLFVVIAVVAVAMVGKLAIDSFKGGGSEVATDEDDYEETEDDEGYEDE
jgi:hypothetical protein